MTSREFNVYKYIGKQYFLANQKKYNKRLFQKASGVVNYFDSIVFSFLSSYYKSMIGNNLGFGTIADKDMTDLIKENSKILDENNIKVYNGYEFITARETILAISVVLYNQDKTITQNAVVIDPNLINENRYFSKGEKRMILFHEVGHLIKHNDILRGDAQGIIDNIEVEIEADEFALNNCKDLNSYKSFIMKAIIMVKKPFSNNVDQLFVRLGYILTKYGRK